MTKTNGSPPAPKPGTPEWRAAGGGTAQLTVRAFGQWLRSAWVADLVSEPEPAMAELVAVVGGVLVGGAA